MGAGVTVDRDVPGDSRYQLLATELGLANHYEAIGRMVVLWGVCTELETDRPPKGRIIACLGKNALEALAVADLGEVTPDGEFRIKGCLGRIEWLAEERRKRSAGGRARAANAARAGGKFVPAGSALDQQEPANDQRSTSEQASAGESDQQEPSKNQHQGKNQYQDQGKNKIEEEDSDPPEAVGAPSVSRKSRAKAKRIWTTEEREIATRVLGKLSGRNSVRYTVCDEHIRLIVGRLEDGSTEMDLRMVVGYCASSDGGLGWADKPEMRKYLRPETLFGRDTIARYLDPARTWAETLEGAA